MAEFVGGYCTICTMLLGDMMGLLQRLEGSGTLRLERICTRCGHPLVAQLTLSAPALPEDAAVENGDGLE
jgi:hypothetical protein